MVKIQDPWIGFKFEFKSIRIRSMPWMKTENRWKLQIDENFKLMDEDLLVNTHCIVLHIDYREDRIHDLESFKYYLD